MSSEHRPAEELDHLVVVSNLGQARNVVAWARTQAASESVLVVVVGARSGAGLVERLVRFVGDRGLAAEPFELPEHPAQPRPLSLRRTVRRYERLVDTHCVGALWICNTDAHYSVLASLFSDAGASVGYIEEGLGTYRSATDTALADPDVADPAPWASISADARRFFGVGSGLSLPDTARRVRWNGRRFVSSAFGHLSRRLARHRAYRALLVRGSSPHAAAFFAPRHRFGEAWVVFPAKLDPGVIDATRVCQLDARPDPDDVRRATALLDEVLGRDPIDLFVSQPYLDRGPIYYGAVAAEIDASGITAVFLQPHPRERSYNVDVLVDELERRRIVVVRDERSRDLPAEALLATNRFGRCFAVASSTLVYGPEWSPECEYRWIGPGVAAALEGSADEVGLRRLISDLDIVRHVRDEPG